MLKRSPDESFVSTPPPSKQPRQGTPSNSDGLKNIRSMSELAKKIPADCIDGLHASLQGWALLEDDKIQLKIIHSNLHILIPDSLRKHTFVHFVSQSDFEKIIKVQKKSLCDAVRLAGKVPLNCIVLENLIIHGMYICYETNQIIQMCSGPIQV
jgi:hypothetical protein